MNALGEIYRQKLNFPHALFIHMDHADAMVATVFKIIRSGSPDLILKICSRKDDYLRESYFLSFFAGKIPLPKVIQLIEPEEGVDGAILMECVQGDLLELETVSKALAWEIGTLLARIHLERTKGYGDLINTASLSKDPRTSFRSKFEEGLEECKDHLPERLLKICRSHFDKDIDLLLSADGPCVIHRDFRPGNLIAFDGKIRGIIDWSSSRSGFAEDDFYPLEFGKWPEGCKNFFLEGYASIRKVPNYKQMMPLLCLSRAIAAIGFTVKRGTWNSKHAKLYQFHRRNLEQLAEREEF